MMKETWQQHPIIGTENKNHFGFLVDYKLGFSDVAENACVTAST